MKDDKLILANATLDLLKVLRMALFNSQESLSPQPNWDELYMELRQQTLSGLVGDILSKLDLDAQLMRTWKRDIIYHLQRYSLLLMAQENVINLLTQAGIKAVVIKGSSASMYYPRPEYRTMGDVDLLIDAEKLENAVALLQSNGYFLVHEREEHERHISLTKAGVVFEVHRQLAWISEPEKAAIIEAAVNEAIDRAESHQLDGRVFCSLPTLENGLVLLHHISQHMEEGIGLRQIIDWMMYVNAVLDDEFWQREFKNIAKQIGLEKLAIVVTRMCQLYLGLTETGRSWCLNADKELCDALLEDVFENGNFGQKLKQGNAQIIKVSSRSHNPIAFLVHLQRIGVKNWRKAQENPLCRAFAWAYQIIEYARMLRTKGLPVSEMSQSLMKGKERAALLKALGVFRLRDGVAIRTENGYTRKKY